MTITKETAVSIAYAYSEIETAEGLLKTIRDGEKDREAPDFRDTFGRRHHSLQLGVPSGSGHRLTDVPPALAKIIIEAHINAKKSEISALCEVAKVELDK